MDLRVSNEDRNQVIEHVSVAYSEGRLTKEEFDDRLHRAATARVHGDLVPIMTDLYGMYPPLRQPPPFAAPPPYDAPARDSGDRVGAGAAHLLPFLGLMIVGPLVLMATAGRTSPYIRKHAVEALNFQLTVLGASIVLAITIVGMVVVPFVWLGAYVLSAVAGVSAMTEGQFRYPLTVRLVK
ncbi:DUF1707 and DUF4870 domain-containing protein [Sinosporangium album]|uniref:DUF1707 and DUF4870 domain-containing protein n=1 Tax=Sinosporangium album TaxID=504805 RepID=UPI001FDF1355|nr:DUF1707 and DUF4870 domain-containing protein [Sinosporangium album]